MTEVKSVHLKSLFKIGFFFYLVVMLAVGIVGLVFMLAGLVTNFSTSALTGALGAIVIYLVLTLIYSLLAAVVLALSGFLYNKVAQKFGGVQVEIGEKE
ncbi:MAG: hypothetical protein M1120_02085 [Patescibacteria group bacterium]|nr:hypothetical protein [Patescibacteria group bacterium]